MNRELKFRVWDKLEKRYLKITPFSKHHYVLDLDGKFHNLQNGSGGDEYVVEQFTGLKDVNGQEIYEGDIVEYCDGQKLPVCMGQYFTGFERRDSHYGWYVSSNEAISDLALDERYAVDEYGVEIIGNINENPELLNMKN